MSDKVQLIKEEIERRFNDNMKASEQYTENSKSRALFTSAAKEDYDLLAFIDSIPEEPVSEGIENELERFAYSLPHSADGFWPKDIDPKSVEARIKYGVRHAWSYEKVMVIARHFAEWQKQQMMKDAVDGQVVYQIGSAEIAPTDIRYKVVSDRVYIPNVKLGDKVKIIVIKED